MKCNVIIDTTRDEEVTVYAHKESGLTEEIARLCEENGLELIGYREDEGTRLELSDILCFTVEDHRIYALTESGKYRMNCRLYHLEQRLPNSFVKIHQSCLANIRKIKRFDTSLAGTLTVCFQNGHRDYVSRRNLKQVKERLGL